MKVGEEGRLFGSVTNMQIEKALKAKGLIVDRRKIHSNETDQSRRRIRSSGAFVGRYHGVAQSVGGIRSKIKRFASSIEFI